MIARRSLLQALVASAAGAAWAPAFAVQRARVGVILPLTGVQSAVANELLIGYRLAVESGKRLGVELELVVEDDRSEAARTKEAVARLGADSGVVAVSGIVGTPHAAAAIPAARAAGLPLLGLRSGAAELRDGKDLVYHLRSSYEDELSRMLQMIAGLPIEAGKAPALSVVYSNDSFGKGALAHLRRQTQGSNVRIVAAEAADRNGADVDAVTRRAVDPKLKADALLLLLITKPAVGALRTARGTGFYGPTFAMSFNAGGELLAVENRQLIRGLGLVSAFSLPRASTDSLATGFRGEALAAGKPEVIASLSAFEGYVYGRALVGAVARAGRDLSRESVVAALNARAGIRVGAESVTFDANRVGREHLQIVYVDRDGLLRS